MMRLDRVWALLGILLMISGHHTMVTMITASRFLQGAATLAMGACVFLISYKLQRFYEEPESRGTKGDD